MKVQFSPRDLNGYLAQLIKPTLVVFVLHFIFEFTLDGLACMFFAAYGLWAVYIIARLRLVEGRAHYEPIIAESLENAKELNASIEMWKRNHDKLEEQFRDYLDWSKKEIRLKEEGIASLLVNAQTAEGEAARMQKRIEQLENGDDIKNVQWELDRVNAEATRTKDSLTAEVTRLKGQLTQARDAHDKELTSVRAQLTQANNLVSSLRNQVNDLLPCKEEAVKLRQEKEITRLKQAFSQSLLRSTDAEICRIANDLATLGVNVSELCNTDDKLRRYNAAQEANKLVLVTA